MFYSQRDPRWADKNLPKSTLTLKGYGCYISSLCMLAQSLTPSELADHQECFVNGGLADTNAICRVLGITYLGKSATPAKEGACIAVTDKYAKSGIPTHFYVKLANGQRVDPYDLTPVPETDDFNIIEYRLFGNVKLVSDSASTPFAPKDESPAIPDWMIPTAEKMKAKGIKTNPMTKIGDLPAGHLLLMVQKFIS